ncbi:MAG: ATP-binding cassette domain-containing protein [Eubacteriales bacterium]|nr:ATP-binding cassette domain-containing protein [Eubacteriales bacterium]
MDSNTHIRLVDVSKTFDADTAKQVKAVRKVNLQIKRGEIYGIIGFSGAGKSTLVRLINLLERPSSGKVIIDGKDITAIPEKELLNRRKKIGMIFQHFNLFESRTVEGNIAFPLKGQKHNTKQRIDELLKLTGLEDKRHSYPSQLSGGQKQRVGIARALANEPDILLCDEATSALDPQTTAEVLELLKRLNKQLGITIVLITHQMSVVKEMCDRVAVMDSGNIIEEDTLYNIFSSSKQDITRRFIDTASNVRPAINLVKENPALLGVKEGDVVARIDFNENSTKEAIISRISRDYNIDVSIIFGNVETIGGLPLGTLLVAFKGEKDAVQKAIKSLQEENIQLEVL